MNPSALVASFNRLSLWRHRVRVWGFTLSAPTFDRSLYLWLHRLGRMGRNEREYFSKVIRPGMHVVDVGANIGLYSLLFAKLVGPEGRVFSFEPDELMVQALRENIVANGVGHAEVFACAVGATAGQAVLQRNALNSGDNRMGESQTLLHSDHATVPVRALQDALHGRRVDFIKMDVQGWEGEALRGLAGLLDANPGLQIYFEFWPYGLEKAGTTIPRLAEILRNLGLHVWLAELRKDAAPVDLEECARALKAGAFTNLLCAR